MGRLRVYILFIAVLLPFLGFTQLTVLMSDGNVQTCNGVLFDTGGQGAGGYQNNENFTLTICPDVPGDVVTVVFNNFGLNTTNTATPPANNMDNLTIYDGNSTGAPTLGTYTGNQLQGTIVSTTSGNTSGCLTFVFNSNSAGTGVFSGTITCSTPCQPPTATFAVPTVAQNPQKICDGETIFFDASASFAQPTFNLVDYIFDFGDGTVDTLQAPTTSHTFNNGPGEYLVTLTVYDDNGCVNMNSEIIKVWVSTVPEFNTVVSDSVICLGESSCLDGSFINPVMYVPAPQSSLSGATYLPDDVGQCFTADLNFGFFTPGQTLTNINDLLGICVNMEHSYMGDLVASIICPNGTSVILHQQGGGGTNLGDPNQADDSLLIGTGWNYCWSPTATNGTWVDNAQFGATPNTIANSSGSQSLVPGVYESVNPLNPLVGCPLNGIWQIEFCDLWGADDGFVFDFSLDLDTSLYPSLTTFTPSIGPMGDSTWWSSTGIASTFITSTSNDSNVICITPTDTGSFNYTFNAYDDFGCTFDTTVTVTVVPGPSVNAGNDTTVCIGSTAQLNAQPINAAPVPCDYTIDMFDTFGDGWNGFGVEVVINGVSVGIFSFNTGSNFSDVFSVNDGDNVVFNTISGVFDSEVSYQILDCNGNVIFSDGVNFGANPIIGNNVFNTVGVSPQVVYNYSWTPVTGLSNPGINNPIATVNADITYYVEIWETGHQACSTFDTITVFVNPVAFAGTDSIVTVCPGSTPFDMLTHLGGNPDTTGAWFDNGNPASNVFDPQTTPPGTYTYTYLINNPICPDSATVQITILPLGDILCDCPLNGFVTTVDVLCFADCNGELLVTDSLGFAIDYSLDGLTWQTDSTFLNLCAGNSTVYTRNSLYGPSCIDTLNYTIQGPLPFLITQLDSINETCFQDCDGEITITSPGALQYSIDNGASFQNTGIYTNLCVGNYNVVTVDTSGCIANANINVTGPPEVIAAFDISPQPTFVPFVEITFTNNSSGATNYFWDIAGTDTFTTRDLVYSFPEKADEYEVCLAVTNNNGCPSQVCQYVIIKEELVVFIPNAFTPDDDNVNESFRPKFNIDMVVEYDFMIFDRWGELIFSTGAPINGWEGTYKGRPVQQGVYVYKIKIKDTNNKHHDYTGSVNLIR